MEGIPKYMETRMGLLPLAKKFADLPDQVKEKYVDHASTYQFGWSHGKEIFQGQPDYSKGSYYNNPQYDVRSNDQELMKKYPGFLMPNIWPTQELPEFEGAFKNLGKLIVNTGKLVARQCDSYQQKITGVRGILEKVVGESRSNKARLLHYFAIPETQAVQTVEESKGNWCGWHNDHGSLTGLTSALFLDEKSNKVKVSDPDAGLFAYSRNAEIFKIDIPEDCLAFQIGETAQIHSGGLLVATPHKVEGSKKLKGISRSTYAVFMEPDWDFHVNPAENRTPNDVYANSTGRLPQGVPDLQKRWNTKVKNFGEFSEITINGYYY